MGTFVKTYARPVSSPRLRASCQALFLHALFPFFLELSGIKPTCDWLPLHLGLLGTLGGSARLVRRPQRQFVRSDWMIHLDGCTFVVGKKKIGGMKITRVTMLGPHGHLHRWKAPHIKFRKVCARINESSTSVLSFVGFIAAPDGATLKEESHALQCLAADGRF